MAFNTNDGRQAFTATATQTDFDFNFKIYAGTDLNVYQNETLLTITTHYTVTIDGDNGGTMTLVSGAAINDAILLVRDLPATRSTDYQNGGDFLAGTIDDDQDYQTYLIADKGLADNQHLRLSEATQGINTELPTPVALQVIRTNVDANGFEFVAIGESDTYLNIANIDTITELPTAPTIETYNVRGYYAQNDGGGGIFNYDATVLRSNANSGTIIDATGTGTGSGCWIRQYSGAINIRWFGVKGDATTDDTINFQRYIDFCQSTLSAIEPTRGNYLVTSTLILDGSVPVIGAGSQFVTVITTDFVGSVFEFNITTTRNGDTGFSGVEFIFNYTGAQTSNAGIGFTGDDATFLQYCNFDDIMFKGCESGFKNTKAARTTAFGLENNVAWCNFSRIRFMAGGGYYVKYGFNFQTGSGTGNNFTDGKYKIDLTGSAFYYTGAGYVVGDILISSCNGASGGGDGATFITVGDNTEYRQNVCFINCQVDAGILDPFNLSQVGVQYYQDWTWIGNTGGGTRLTAALGYLDGSIIYDRGVSESKVSKYSEGLTTVGAIQIEICKVDLKTHYTCALTLNLSVFIGGVNSYQHTSLYHCRNTGTPSPILKEIHNTPTGDVTITTSVSGTVTTFYANFTSTAAGSRMDAQSTAIGRGFRLERT